MAKSKPTRFRLQERRNERPWLVRFVLAHKRLFGIIVIGLLVLLLLPKDELPVPRSFFAWDVGVTCFLVAVYWMVSHSDAALIRRQSAMQDEGRNLVLIGAIGAVIISVAVILVWLSGEMSAGRAPTRDLVLVFLTIPLSWVFIHTMFILHYAHEYYAEHRGAGGMASQVADIVVTSKPLRHIVLIHSVVSFVFNVTLITMTVSIVGDAISSRQGDVTSRSLLPLLD